MKKLFLILIALLPVAIFASNENSQETDIIQRTVNFIIFIAILWFLLADKIKLFFQERTASIQGQLDKVQETLRASKEKVIKEQQKLEDAKKIAIQIVEDAKADVETIKEKVIKELEADILNLERNLKEMIKIETSKAKREVVLQVLEELLKSENIELNQDELVDIVLKKAA